MQLHQFVCNSISLHAVLWAFIKWSNFLPEQLTRTSQCLFLKWDSCCFHSQSVLSCEYQYVFGITGSWPVMEGLSQAEVGQSRPSQLAERERGTKSPQLCLFSGGQEERTWPEPAGHSRASEIRPRNSEAFRKISWVRNIKIIWNRKSAIDY